MSFPLNVPERENVQLRRDTRKGSAASHHKTIQNRTTPLILDICVATVSNVLMNIFRALYFYRELHFIILLQKIIILKKKYAATSVTKIINLTSYNF